MELELIEESGWRAFPPRLPIQPIFYPVLDLDYARQIARDWNTRDAASGYAGHVTEFDVEAEFLSLYDVQIVGAKRHREYLDSRGRSGAIQLQDRRPHSSDRKLPFLGGPGPDEM